jgi:hypothetical protein
MRVFSPFLLYSVDVACLILNKSFSKISKNQTAKFVNFIFKLLKTANWAKEMKFASICCDKENV